MTDPFCTVTACVFDAYGTIFDVAAPGARYSERMGDKAETVIRLWRDRQLQYTWLRSMMHRHSDFWSITCDSLDYALSAVGRQDDTSLREDLLNAYRTLDCYPDAALVLRLLKENNYQRAILSNASPVMLSEAVVGAGLQDLFSSILSVEAVGCYKPDPTVYRHAVQRLDIPPERILFVSANGWDVAGASAYGLRTVWINRNKTPVERLDDGPTVQLESLSELISLLRLPR